MITWRQAAGTYPEFVQWVVQRDGGLPDKEIVGEQWDRLREEYSVATGVEGNDE